MKSIYNSSRKPIKSLALILFLQLINPLAWAADIFTGTTGQRVELSEVISQLRGGQVVILSEQHDSAAHHQNQRDFLTRLSGASLTFNVGMEFFSYPDQPLVDSYAKGTLSEVDFLKQINWGSFPFAEYRTQVLSPYFYGGQTIALNLPRSITSKVSRGGLAALDNKDRALLPPQLILGNNEYFERFSAVMQDHIKDPTVLQNYFTAHCLWDETMAWQAVNFMSQHPDQILVIIVGDFHAAYEDGLVARLEAQGLDTVVISQVSDPAEVAPHPRYGRRGDYVWLSP